MSLYLMIGLIIFSLFLLPLLPFYYSYKLLKFFCRYFSSTENIKGKVVLITGASAGIGEHLAHECAKRGACLVIVARRENLLQQVAEKARRLGSPDVVPICADVSKVDDCKRFVEEAVNHFGRLDHLVNNAGIAPKCLIEDATYMTRSQPMMDVNFWGSVYPAYFALSYLKSTKGSIFVNASGIVYVHPPGFSIYDASKAALVSFYETARAELAPEISITIATLGRIQSEMSAENFTGPFLSKVPAMSSSACAKSIVDAICRKERYVIEPKFCRILFLLIAWFPEVIYFVNRLLNLHMKASISKSSSVPPRSKKISD